MISFFVHGQPVAQGSMRAFTPKGHSRPIITSTAKGLAAWRRLVADAAQPHAKMHPRGVAVAVECIFFMPRPASLPKRKPTDHTKRPDLDKLLRAGLDALDGIFYEDDSQVNLAVVHKRYAAVGGRVGVRISIVPYRELTDIPVLYVETAASRGDTIVPDELAEGVS